MKPVLNKILIALVSFMVTACEVVEIEEGEQVTLCYNYFRDCVNPLYVQSGCAVAGCHLLGSSGGGSFRTEPTGSIDSFISTVGVTDLLVPANSRLLLMPQDMSHTGGVYPAFAAGGVCYQQVESWIELQVTEPPLEQRPDDPCAAMPICGVTDIADC